MWKNSNVKDIHKIVKYKLLLFYCMIAATFYSRRMHLKLFNLQVFVTRNDLKAISNVFFYMPLWIHYKQKRTLNFLLCWKQSKHKERWVTSTTNCFNISENKKEKVEIDLYIIFYSIFYFYANKYIIKCSCYQRDSLTFVTNNITQYTTLSLVLE